jgi:hypothetical protein
MASSTWPKLPFLIAAFNRLNGPILPAWPKLGFTLEGGKRDLERYFAQVELHRSQQGAMHITEAQPLVACITSLGTPDAPTKAKLLEYVEALIGAEGTVLVHTQSGLFIARK